jgi:RNA-directed DNA polymerase
VRQIRAMLHAWDKFGLEAAQKEYMQKYNKKSRSPWTNTPSFKKVVRGKIAFLGMVRGKTDPIYIDLLTQLKALSPDFIKIGKRKKQKSKDPKPIKFSLITEGKTDWKHLEYANQKLLELGHKFNFVIEFNKNESEMGASDLLKSCRLQAKISKPVPMVFVFDRDKLDTIKEAVDDANEFKNWGNGTYSFAIPIPTHRRDTPNISIEFYYKDEEIKREDGNGRRLYLSNEFQLWGKHKNLPLICHELNKIKDSNISIIDNKVFDDNGRSMALSKDDFVENIRNQKKGFDDFDVTEFINIFNVLTKISERMKSK